MDSTDTSKIDFKVKMKERARLARKEAYERQKAWQKERTLALKASPEFQAKQAERKAAKREFNRQIKNKDKIEDKIVEERFTRKTQEEALAEQARKDAELLGALKPTTTMPESSELKQKKPMLRLVKN